MKSFVQHPAHFAVFPAHCIHVLRQGSGRPSEILSFVRYIARELLHGRIVLLLLREELLYPCPHHCGFLLDRISVDSDEVEPLMTSLSSETASVTAVTELAA